MSSPRIVYRPREDATAEAEVDALAAIYKFVLKKQKAAHPGGPDDPERRPDEIRANTSIYE